MCGRGFGVLAALFNHLESETCGTMRFGTVQEDNWVLRWQKKDWIDLAACKMSLLKM
jgi:hypothetical protein